MLKTPQATPVSVPNEWFCFCYGQDGQFAQDCVEAFKKTLFDQMNDKNDKTSL